MIYKLRISEAAENDIREAFLWYEEQKENLGHEFEKHLINTIDTLHKKPDLIQIRYHQIRVAFLKRFPYGIHFTISNNQILIVAVFHTSRDTEKWPNKSAK